MTTFFAKILTNLKRIKRNFVVKVKPKLRKHFNSYKDVVQTFFNIDLEDREVPTFSLIVLVLCLIYGFASILMRTPGEIPSNGGEFTEGIIGIPKYLTPFLAQSDADRDVVALVYSGVTRKDFPNGYKLDLAEKIASSSNSRVYTITLKKDLVFHDGQPVTSKDLAYTYRSLGDEKLKSSLQTQWKGVVSTIIDERTLKITLPQSRPTFIDALSVGIMPEHIWGSVPLDTIASSRMNMSPVGTGPFKVKNVVYTSDGTPRSFELIRFENFALRTAYLDRINLKFFEGIDQLKDSINDSSINAWARIPPSEIRQVSKNSNLQLARFPLSRAFALFFNINKVSGTLASAKNRKELDSTIDRTRLVDEALSGFGNPLTSLSDVSWKKVWSKTPQQDILPISEGTRLSQLSFVLTVPDVPELLSVASYLKEVWTKQGATIMISTVPQEKIVESVVTPRSFEALLYGITLSQYSDLAAYLHSSERSSPGLNISGYSNKTVDRDVISLANLSRSTVLSSSTPEIARLSESISEEVPMIFLYQPELTYALPSKLKGAEPQLIAAPRDRFVNVADWYMRTKRE